MKGRDTKVLRLAFITRVESFPPSWQLKHDEIAPADLIKSALLFGKTEGEKKKKQPACAQR